MNLPKSQFTRLCFAVLISTFGLFILSQNLTRAASYRPVSQQDQVIELYQATVTATNQITDSFRPTAETTPEPEVTPEPVSAVSSTAALTDVSLIDGGETFTASFELLGNDPFELSGRQDSGRVSVAVPSNWKVLGNGLLMLDLSFFYSQVDVDNQPAVFGDVMVSLNNQLIETIVLEESIIDRRQFAISLPQDILVNPDQSNISVDITYKSSGFLCEIAHEAALTVHSSSTISFNYVGEAVQPDLANYPFPLFQRSFFPDIARFVLAEDASEQDLTSAAGIAAKLGQLTSNNLVISATTDTDFIASPTADNIIVIGRPQDNQLLQSLYETAELPVSLHRQQVNVSTEGPIEVSAGDTFTYNYSVSNPTNDTTELNIISTLPPHTKFVECSGNCSEAGLNQGLINWTGQTLGPDENIDLSLTLKASDSLAGALLDNVVTVSDANAGPLGANTFVSNITGSASAETNTVEATLGEDFFVFDGQAISHNDGIIQFVPSPWDQDRVVLVVTALSDEGLHKAGQTLSSDARFPGMNGQVAVVKEAFPPAEFTVEVENTSAEFKFTDLGSPENLSFAGEKTRVNSVFFDIPYKRQLAENASLELFFSHSPLISFENSGLNLFINGDAIASVKLNNETASNGHLSVDLSNVDFGDRTQHRLTIQVTMVLPDQGCARQDSSQAWLIVKGNSKLFLPTMENPDATTSIEDFPVPFNNDPTLSDVKFALPSVPTTTDWESTLRLAAVLGSSTDGRTVVPSVIIGDENIEEAALEDFQIIVIGRPTAHPLIQQINADLPQPFIDGTDQLEQRHNDVVFRLPPGIDFGLLQLLPSAWKESNSLLAITGTSDKGVQLARESLLGQTRLLAGNLAFIRDDGQIAAIDTRALSKKALAATIATAIPEIAAVPTATPEPEPTPSQDSETADRLETTSSNLQPIWLIPFVAANSLLVIAIFAFAFWQARNRSS